MSRRISPIVLTAVPGKSRVLIRSGCFGARFGEGEPLVAKVGDDLQAAAEGFDVGGQGAQFGGADLSALSPAQQAPVLGPQPRQFRGHCRTDLISVTPTLCSPRPGGSIRSTEQQPPTEVILAAAGTQQKRGLSKRGRRVSCRATARYLVGSPRPKGQVTIRGPSGFEPATRRCGYAFSPRSAALVFAILLM